MNHYQQCEQFNISYQELCDILFTHNATILTPYIPLLNQLNYHVEYLPYLNGKNAFALMCEGWHLAINEREDMNLLLSSINQYYNKQQQERPILWHNAMLAWTFSMLHAFVDENKRFGGIFSNLIVKRDLEGYIKEPWLHDARQFFKEALQSDISHPDTLRAIYRAYHLPTPFFAEIIPDTWKMFLEGHATEDSFIAQYQLDPTHSEIPVLF